jgi:epsilon-lactone hydrolase
MMISIIKMIVRKTTARLDILNHYAAIRKWADILSKVFLRVSGKCVSVSVDAGGVPGEWISRRGTDPKRTILFLHGGGYVLFDINLYRDLVFRITRASGARTLAINYRLAPEHPHPAAIDDAMTAYRWLLAQGTEPSRIAVMGDSAGGGMTLALLQKLRDAKMPLPGCAVCMSPWADLTRSGASYRENESREPMVRRKILADCVTHYAGKQDTSNPSISPLLGKFNKMPPMLIQVGTEEVLLDDARIAAEKATKAGAKVELQVWPGMIHDFQMWARILPDARKAIAAIGRFVEKQVP